MFRLLSLVSLLAVATAPCALRAQESADGVPALGPRFLLATRAARRVPVDVARSPVLNQRISLDLEGVTLEEALRVVSSKAGLHLLYSKPLVPLGRPVHLRAEDISVAGALAELLLATDVDVLFSSGNQVALVPRSLVGETGSIRGTVRDAVTSGPLSGVAVIVVGTPFGATTGPEGQYTISAVPPGTYRLRARRLGYAPRDTTIVVQDGLEAVVDVRLPANAVELQAVVAIGYGEQSKATLTGAVSAVEGQELKSVPTVNLSNTMSGRLPGVVTITRSGEPGYDGARIRIRGNHTLNDNSALVVIDGVPDRVGGLERLDASDIESISVLKDASAAIYGSRAANGVLLITTKRGSGSRPELTASLNQGFNQPTRLPRMADAATYMTMLDEIDAYRNQAPRYAATEIQKYRDRADPWLYPNTDWFAAVIKPMSLQNVGHVALRGTADRLGYYLSLGGQTEDGYYRNSATRYNQYSFRSNIDGQVSSHMRLRFDVTGRLENRNFPTRSAGSIFRELMRGKPNLPAYWPNGKPGPDIEYGDNPAVIATPATGYEKDDRYFLQSNLGGDWEVPGVSGLTVHANASYDVGSRADKAWRTPWTLYTWDYQTRDANGEPVLQPALRGFGTPQLGQYDLHSTSSLLNLYAEYRREFGSHHVGIMGGIERQKVDSSSLSGFRDHFVSSQVDQLFAGGKLGDTSGGTEWTPARQNYFSRLNYAFKNKYLLELVGREDGSYIFPAGKRFGFFPAVSAGWRISDEPFFRDRVSLFDDLKLRVSWGKTGNDRIEPWQYLPTYGFGGGYVFGGNTEVTSVYQTRTPNPNVTWEVATQRDIGMDAALLQNRLSIVFDYFREQRSNILWYRNASVPQTTGLSLPRENIGQVSSWGYDGSIAWREQLAGDVSYDVTFNFGHARNRVDYWDEPPGAPAWQRSTGRSMCVSVSSCPGLLYQAIGIFRDSADVASHPHWSGARPGDVIFADIDGNGVIDARDRVRPDKTGDPAYTFGLKLGAQVSQFDATVFFQGSFDAVQYFLTESGDIGNYTAEYAAERWTPQNPDAPGPRAYNRQDEYWISNANTYFLRDASYVRLKSVELGYHFPSRLAGRLGLRDLRVYANGYNLLLLDRFKVVDPETRDTNGQYYPQQRVFNFGASVMF
ncbi:MAG TPA: TonB-dependent receptor [Gemmatimonadales bacterium]